MRRPVGRPALREIISLPSSAQTAEPQQERIRNRGSEDQGQRQAAAHAIALSTSGCSQWMVWIAPGEAHLFCGAPGGLCLQTCALEYSDRCSRASTYRATRHPASTDRRRSKGPAVRLPPAAAMSFSISRSVRYSRGRLDRRTSRRAIGKGSFILPPPEGVLAPSDSGRFFDARQRASHPRRAPRAIGMTRSLRAAVSPASPYRAAPRRRLRRRKDE